MAGPDGQPIETDGGYFDVPDDPTDPEKVCQRMQDPKDYFIFDIQTHSVNRANTLYDSFLRQQRRFQRECIPASLAPVPCFARDEYTRLMFAESDTTVAVLSGLPAVDDANNRSPMEIAEAGLHQRLAEGTSAGEPSHGAPNRRRGGLPRSSRRWKRPSNMSRRPAPEDLQAWSRSTRRPTRRRYSTRPNIGSRWCRGSGAGVGLSDPQGPPHPGLLDEVQRPGRHSSRAKIFPARSSSSTTRRTVTRTTTSKVRTSRAAARV